ncbi:MAG: type I restriction enzyme HsdR N-terminal domain-containing protein [Desulfobacterales bacterium]|jgi:hypothetical protein
MTKTLKPYSMITDFVTGQEIPNVGAEENRQMVEKFLVSEKGYAKADIEVDVAIELTISGQAYRSQIDLIVSADGGAARFMVFKCAAASLGSREREILAAARLLGETQIPLSVVSDGRTAIVLDTVSGRKLGEGLDAIPSKDEAIERLKKLDMQPFPEEKRERESLIFRSYDSMNVNVGRNINRMQSESSDE